MQLGRLVSDNAERERKKEGEWGGGGGRARPQNGENKQRPNQYNPSPISHKKHINHIANAARHLPTSGAMEVKIEL
jgi:hypothetical protein